MLYFYWGDSYRGIDIYDVFDAVDASGWVRCKWMVLLPEALIDRGVHLHNMHAVGFGWECADFLLVCDVLLEKNIGIFGLDVISYDEETDRKSYTYDSCDADDIVYSSGGYRASVRRMIEYAVFYHNRNGNNFLYAPEIKFYKEDIVRFFEKEKADDRKIVDNRSMLCLTMFMNMKMS